ncbi:hypothetical protein ACIHCQ_34655 [Streptomyces sp. NPDC052236]|uniref:hypothetical protein n=1 Tax=Streptomyces sp. NPDC052236 TaxID=3365686 RepID=UPI0037D70BA7
MTGIPAFSQKALMEELAALGTNALQAVPTPGAEPPVLLPEKSVDMVGRIAPVANTHAVVHRSDRIDASDYSGVTVPAAKRNVLEAVNGTVGSGKFLDAATEKLPTVVPQIGDQDRGPGDTGGRHRPFGAGRLGGGP